MQDATTYSVITVEKKSFRKQNRFVPFRPLPAPAIAPNLISP